jgi:hypothetical protein
MDERVKSVAVMPEAEESFLALCERFGISRKRLVSIVATLLAVAGLQVEGAR